MYASRDLNAKVILDMATLTGAQVFKHSFQLSIELLKMLVSGN